MEAERAAHDLTKNARIGRVIKRRRDEFILGVFNSWWEDTEKCENYEF